MTGPIIVQGDAQTRCADVAADTAPIIKGDLIEYFAAGTIRRAVYNSEVVAGVALTSGGPGTRVTFAMPPAIVRVALGNDVTSVIGGPVRSVSGGRVGNMPKVTAAAAYDAANVQAIMDAQVRNVGRFLEARAGGTAPTRVLVLVELCR